MNISRLSQSLANVQPAPAKPLTLSSKPATSDETAEKKRHGVVGLGKSLPEPVVDVPKDGAAGVEAPEEHGHDHAARVAHFASRIDARLANAIASGNLSEDQVTALKAAAEQFHALMNRIANADFSHTPQRQVHFALSQLHNQIEAIFQQQVDPQPAPATSGEAGPAQTTPSIDALA